MSRESNEGFSMKGRADLVVYDYRSDKPQPHHRYVDAYVIGLIGRRPTRIFDLGCGNGAFARTLARLGHEVTGVDPSASGIRIARGTPGLRLEEGHGYEALAERFGKFPVVISLEVIGHLLRPREFIATCRDLVEPGGKLILSTPFHGYWKNLAIALLNSGDQHYDPLSDVGPLRFWSERSLRLLLSEAGFRDLSFYRAGRIPILAKSLIVVARRA